MHVDVDAKIFLIESKIWAGAHKSIKQLYVSNLYLKKKRKKAVLLLTADDISTDATVTVTANFYDGKIIEKMSLMMMMIHHQWKSCLNKQN